MSDKKNKITLIVQFLYTLPLGKIRTKVKELVKDKDYWGLVFYLVFGLVLLLAAINGIINYDQAIDFILQLFG